jgi:hypothetical protein
LERSAKRGASQALELIEGDGSRFEEDGQDVVNVGSVGCDSIGTEFVAECVD